MNLASRQTKAAAQTSFEQARQLLQDLVAKYPDNPQFRCDLAVTLRSLAPFEAAAGHADKAKAYLESSLDDFTMLLKRFPTNAQYASELANTEAAIKAQATNPAK